MHASEWPARLGLLARGAVYALVGVLALKLALGDGGKTTTQVGAMKTLANESSGKILLIALAVGLAGYAFWRLSSAFTGRAVDGAKERVSALISGIAYGALAVAAVQIVVGAGTRSSSGADKATKGVFGWSHGRELVGVVGAIVIVEGIAQLRRGLKRSFLERSDTGRMHAATEKVFTATGTVGYCARGVVFGMIGTFLVKAAIDYKAKEAIALDGALAKVADAPAGPLLLGIVAAGLVAFAVYCVADSRYRRVD